MATMNVPLKKRHNYGKLNGSVSSLNEPSVKRLHSSAYSNCDDDDDEDSEYDEQSSNMDIDSSIIGPATMGRSVKVCRKKPHQYLSIGNKAVPADNKTSAHKSATASSSSSVIMASSASNQDSSEHNDDDSTSSSSDADSSASSQSSDDGSDANCASIYPLTEDALAQHNADFEPMNSKERIQFWNIGDEFSDIEDDFDEQQTIFSKPIRSERVQKRMYKMPAPVYSTSSRKSKKEEKTTKKTDNKPSATAKKPKADTKVVAKKSAKVSPPKVVKSKEKAKKTEKKTPNDSKKERPPPKNQSKKQPKKVDNQSKVMNITPFVDHSATPFKVSNSIVETRPTDGIQSAIKFRVSYGKEGLNRSGSFKIPTTPNNTKTLMIGCANCGKHSQSIEKMNESVSTNSSLEMHLMSGNNREEFYKYLGIDTNPAQEKSPPIPSPTESNALYNHRRSLRVFIQQRQNEFSRTNEKMSKLPSEQDDAHGKPSANGKLNGESILRKTHENGRMCLSGDEMSSQTNGIAKSANLISSHIKQRHSYEPTSATIGFNRSNAIGNVCSPLTNHNDASSAFQETDIVCNVPANARRSTIGHALTSNRFGETSGQTNSDQTRPRVLQKRKILLPSPMMLTEMFKRYQQCFKKGFAMRKHQRQTAAKKLRKRPSNTTNLPTESMPMDASNSNANTQPNGTTAQSSTMLSCDDLVNAFSPTSITHSNASSDSAIAVNSNVNDLCQPKITLTSSGSLQWKQDAVSHINKSQFRNPLDAKHGAVLAILTHTVSPSTADVIVVIQQSRISYWYSTAKILSMFGVARSWMRIADIVRVNNDTEVDALYQHRLIDLGEQFPVYVELRANESPPDEFRQCFLTFVYLNVYFVRPDEKNQPQMALERVNLDTIKGFANSIRYTALKTSPSVIMTWTEHNVNNQTRCGIIKYTLKTPTLDNIDDIFDYSYMQHDINTLFAINDYHVVGCGDRTVSMWDHRNGNLLIDIEIELPTIGQNIGCYSVGDNVPEYMLLVQLTSCEASNEYDQQLKVMAVQTVDPYNFRTLHTHNIPNSFGKIRSIFNKDDMLTITFVNGSMMFLNIASPHTIYMRNVEPKKPMPQINGINCKENADTQLNQLFAQSNGQVIDVTNNRVAIKSIWEYFIEQNPTQTKNQLTI